MTIMNKMMLDARPSDDLGKAGDILVGPSRREVFARWRKLPDSRPWWKRFLCRWIQRFGFRFLEWKCEPTAFWVLDEGEPDND